MVNPADTMAQRGQHAVHGRWAAFFPLELLDVVSGHGAGPLVGVAATGGLDKEVKKDAQISGFVLNAVLGVGPGLLVHVQVKPGN